MHNMKQSFIRFCLENKVLAFGSFKLKSGRISPYFFNAGLFYTGASLQELGWYYAQCLLKHTISYDVLFGPAYKGFLLATSTAIALAEDGKSIEVSFNRKEIKDHGEKGLIIGAPLQNKKVIIIDDVVTAGTAFREAQHIIETNQGHLIGMIIALDRCESGQNPGTSAVQEIASHGISIFSIINFYDLVEYLKLENQHDMVRTMLEYHKQYGVIREKA